MLEVPFVPLACHSVCVGALRIIIDRGVGQVTELVVDVLCVVPVTAESDDSVSVEVDLHRPHLTDQYVNAHVPLNASDQARLLYVLLDDGLLLVLKHVNVTDEADAFAFAEVGRLANPDLLLFGLSLHPVENLKKFVVFVW